MPRTKLDRISAPKRDPIKALINDRANALHYTQDKLAGVMGVSRATTAQRMGKQHTEEWPLSEVKALCTALRVEIEPNEAATICRCLGIQVRGGAGAANSI